MGSNNLSKIQALLKQRPPATQLELADSEGHGLVIEPTLVDLEAFGHGTQIMGAPTGEQCEAAELMRGWCETCPRRTLYDDALVMCLVRRIRHRAIVRFDMQRYALEPALILRPRVL